MVLLMRSDQALHRVHGVEWDPMRNVDIVCHIITHCQTYCSLFVGPIIVAYIETPCKYSLPLEGSSISHNPSLVQNIIDAQWIAVKLDCRVCLCCVTFECVYYVQLCMFKHCSRC